MKTQEPRFKPRLRSHVSVDTPNQKYAYSTGEYTYHRVHSKPIYSSGIEMLHAQSSIGLNILLSISTRWLQGAPTRLLLRPFVITKKIRITAREYLTSTAEK